MGPQQLAELLRHARCAASIRRRVMQHMLDAGVSTRRGVMNSHLEGAYATVPGPRLPRSISSQERGLILPLLPGALTSQVRAVLDGLSAAVGHESATAGSR